MVPPGGIRDRFLAYYQSYQEPHREVEQHHEPNSPVQDRKVAAGNFHCQSPVGEHGQAIAIDCRLRHPNDHQPGGLPERVEDNPAVADSFP